ncbi:hypothetical protein AAF712_007244 [Marasmius tenuissimus]|uniref:Potassium channel domain-containing protein n=1 Tax=Marasmius tenuissimus TaxID=585030 RepID=A0ABR2ZXE7_9AGAR
MNDPGLDEPIQATANEISHGLENGGDRQAVKRRRKSTQEESQGEHVGERKTLDSLHPTRWWFVSTVFPLAAGTLGPLANLFSVCALVQTWRIGENGERIKDPGWLIAVNTVSLGFALAANLLLLFTFARRIRYLVALPLIVILWYLSSITLIVILILGRRLAHSSSASHRVSQSYFYGLLSAIIYVIISTLLTVNYACAHPGLPLRVYKPTFEVLTMPQRTLMLQTTSFTLYLALGAGIFARVEHWDFVDAVYWADYTLLTIGLGSDFPLQTAIGRGLLIPWAVGGIIIIGLVVGSVRGLVLERGKRKVGKRAVARAVAKWRDGRKGSANSNSWSREEFDTMRAIQERASVTRRYTSLGVSALVFVVVWLCGALVFWYAEDAQGWSYPTALFFTYTSLLTIGYGDFIPQSTSGKPFFVLWSLLAVPAVTILISNMGDTVVSWVRNGTLWLGRWTLLPERKGKDGTATQLGGDLGKLGGAIEMAEGSRGTKQGSLAAKIAKEIRIVSVDIGKKPPRRYQWDDWQRWMGLLSGGDAANPGEFLDDNGPLFSDASETEWVLERLCRRLEEVLEAEPEDRGASA